MKRKSHERLINRINRQRRIEATQERKRQARIVRKRQRIDLYI